MTTGRLSTRGVRTRPGRGGVSWAQRKRVLLRVPKGALRSIEMSAVTTVSVLHKSDLQCLKVFSNNFIKQVCYQKWRPAVCCSKANTRGQSWWKGKFALFWRLATGGGWWEGGLVSKGRFLHRSQSGGKSFYRRREGASCRDSTVGSDGHLEIGHWCSDQRHLGCFKYS